MVHFTIGLGLLTYINDLLIIFIHHHMVAYAVGRYALPAFGGQLSNGDKDRLDGLFRKVFKRGLCSDIFRIHDLARDADSKLFRQALDNRHCLHPLFPKERPKKMQSSLRSRRHSYTLPHINFLYTKTPL